MSFEGRVVIVTGANSGIGRCAALQLAGLGARLTITGRNERTLEGVAGEIEKASGRRALAVVAELRDEAALRNVVERTVERYGAVHALVNNAATLELGGIECASAEQLENVWAANVRGTFRLTALAVPHLKKSRGCVVNVSSINAMRAYPFCVAYSMSKAALDHMTRSLAVELAPHGVRVNGVNPGLVDTAFMKRAGLSDFAFEQAMECARGSQPLGRLGRADEVARLIVFLADDQASFFVNGATVPVDGAKVNFSG